MNARIPLWMVAGLAIAALATATAQAHPESAEAKAVVQYFNQKDGSLFLSTLPPSARNHTTWSQSGWYYSQQGLKIEIPLENSISDAVVSEDSGVDGWIQVQMKYAQASTVSLGSPPAGKFEWRLVEGDRSAALLLDCRYNDVYYCNQDKKEARYRAAFPGHEGSGKPHTHGPGMSASESLESDGFGWLLTYTVPPCSTTNYCYWIGGQARYTFSVVVDGTTSVRLFAEETAPAAPTPEETPDAPAASPGNETPPSRGNSTGNGTSGGNQSNGSGNSTSGNGSAGGNAPASAPGFAPQAYRAEPAGKAPGLGLAALLGGISFAVHLGRRRIYH